MEYETAINNAIGCVMASYMSNEKKREVIDTLREIESVVTGVEFEEGEE